MKKSHTVYFEIYGKKMKAKILAESNDDAKTQIKEKIIFHKVVKEKDDDFNKSVDFIESIFDILGKKY